MSNRQLDGVVDGLPWPNVRGKRCLVLAAEGAPDLARAARDRGAATVDESATGEYDVVLAWGVLAAAATPADAVADIRKATRGVAVSCEPMDLWSSLWSRGRPLFVPAGDTLGFNGAGHRYLLEGAGLDIERVGRPFVVVGDGGDGGMLERAATRLLTGSSAVGRLHRALLVRPTGA